MTAQPPGVICTLCLGMRCELVKIGDSRLSQCNGDTLPAELWHRVVPGPCPLGAVTTRRVSEEAP